MTPSLIITQAKNLIQGSRFSKLPDAHRDTVLLDFVNQTIQTASVLRPDIFATVADVTLTPNSALQQAPAGAVRLIDVLTVEGGAVLREVSRKAMDLSVPDWASSQPGTPIHWMRNPRNPAGFYVYPRPTDGVVAVVEYAISPPTYALNDTIDMPPAYAAALSAGAAALALRVYPEAANAEMARELESRYNNLILESVNARALTDYDSSGLDQDKMME